MVSRILKAKSSDKGSNFINVMSQMTRVWTRLQHYLRENDNAAKFVLIPSKCLINAPRSHESISKLRITFRLKKQK